jgi:tRNA A-37 threonylcarbamoyl transferase component Bud32
MDELGQLDPSEPQTEYRRLSSQTTIPPEKPAASGCALPERFGRYRVSRCLGQGAMGAVYLADDTQLDRPVALKIPKFAADGGDSELIERFYREARAAATLRHSNLCPVYDAGEIDGVHYLSMAFIEGRPLSEVLAESGPPPQRDAAAIVLKLAKALDTAHANGVIHRDLKPANIMVDRHNEPIVMDFGLARRINKDDSRLTQDGLLMGSPAYMSPEQVEGDIEKIGPAADIYSLGIIFYELMAGQPPFQGSIASVMGQVMTAIPKSLCLLKPDVDPSLESICMRMIAKRPEDRFASMHEVATALESYMAGHPTDVVIRKRVPIHHAQASKQSREHTRGLFIPTWMAATGVVVLLAAFGVTWQMIALMLKPQPDVNLRMQDRVAKGEYKTIVLNTRTLTPEEVKWPIALDPGKNVLKVDDDESTIVVPEDDGPYYLVEWKKRPLRNAVTDWVFSIGGKVKIDASNEPISDASALPKGKFQITEVDLSGVKNIPDQYMDLIEELRDSLKRLVIPKEATSHNRLEKLKEHLGKTCQVQANPP